MPQFDYVSNILFEKKKNFKFQMDFNIAKSHVSPDEKYVADGNGWNYSRMLSRSGISFGKMD